MVLPGRNYAVAGADYRYGFNDKEKDDELKGEGNSYDYGARMYDPRLGRWMSTDSKEKTYPGLSPYHFTYNNPILFNDPDGNDGRIAIIPNSDGTGGKIIVESVIHLFGPAATMEYAEKLNEDFGKVLGSVGEFVDSKGKKWSIEFNITYSAENSERISEIAKEVIDEQGNWHGVGLMSDLKIKKDLHDQISGFCDGDNLLYVGPTVDGDNNTISDYIAQANTDNSKTPFHETFHLLGFPHVESLISASEKYYHLVDIMEGSNSELVTKNVNKLMIHPIHYQELLYFVKTIFKEMKWNGMEKNPIKSQK